MAAESCPEIAGDKKMGGEKTCENPAHSRNLMGLNSQYFQWLWKWRIYTIYTPKWLFQQEHGQNWIYWDSILASDSGLPRAVEKFTIQHYAQVIKHGNEHSSIFRRSWNEVPQIINALMLMAVNDSLHW